MSSDDGAGTAPAVPEPNSDDRPKWIIPLGVVIILALVVGLIVALTRDDTSTSTTASTASPSGGEIFLEPTGDNGADPFAASVAEPAPTSTVAPDVPVTLAPATASGPAPTAPVFTTAPPRAPTSGGPVAVTARSGSTPGLYGGTRNQHSCDKQKLIDFLNGDAAKAVAWAGVQGIAVADLGKYINGLTSVVLRSDTRVTNHGFANGKATTHQSVLQAGTAVLIDDHGVPRARCACGNPLLPPTAVAKSPKYTGPKWQGFSPGNVTVINSSTTVINVITIIDITNGEPFGRPSGPQGGPDQPMPGAGSSSSSSTTTTMSSTTTTTPTSSGIFTLVDVTHTVGELRNNWTVDDRAGTAAIVLGPGQRGDYKWTVPQTIDPKGTSITWGGGSTGNINISISPRSDSIVFDRSDLELNVTGGPAEKTSVMKVSSTANEVKLIFGMGFSVDAIYTYRR